MSESRKQNQLDRFARIEARLDALPWDRRRDVQAGIVNFMLGYCSKGVEYSENGAVGVGEVLSILERALESRLKKEVA